jgi:hypothetical protein
VTPRFAPITVLAVVLALGVWSGCVRSQATSCGDKLCPVGLACARGTCVDQTVVTACARQPEGATCEVAEIGTGACQAGLCMIGRCGDGVINPFEACDGNELAGKTCLDFGSTDKHGLTCTADCGFDTSKCTAFCGDGKRSSSEQCDGTELGKATCITRGFYGGQLTCTQRCEINTGGCAGMCGDGVRNGFNEQCDGADFGAATCATRGYLGAVSPMLCTAACALDPTSCTCGEDLCTRTTQKCVLVGEILTCEAT